MDIVNGRPLRCGLYCRVSTPQQSKEDRFSLREQEAEDRHHAADRGWMVDDRFVLHEVASGYKPMRERPKLDALLNALGAGDIDVLLCHDPDRLSRSQVVTGVILDRIEQAQRHHPAAELAFVLYDFENDATGRFVLNARTYAAELQRERITENTTRGLRGKAKSGKPIGNARPTFGLVYSDDRSRYLPDPLAVGHVGWLFEQADKGLSLRKLAAGLEARGVLPPYHGRSDRRSPTGRNDTTRWTAKTVRAILTNRNYLGEGAVFGSFWTTRPARREADAGRVVKAIERRPVDDPKIIPLPEGVYPQVVAPDLFARVRDRLLLNRRETMRPDRDPQLGVFRRGFIVCGVCGHSAKVEHNRSGPQYVCNQPGDRCRKAAIQVGLIDAQAWPLIQEVLNRSQAIEDRLRHLDAKDRSGEELSSIGRVIAGIEGQMANLATVARMLTSPDAAAPLVAQLELLATQKRAAEHERAEVQLRHDAASQNRSRLQRAVSYTEEVRRQVAAENATLDWDTKRTILGRFGAKVVLYPASHAPRWALRLSWDVPASADPYEQAPSRLLAAGWADQNGEDKIVTHHAYDVAPKGGWDDGERAAAAERFDAEDPGWPQRLVASEQDWDGIGEEMARQGLLDPLPVERGLDVSYFTGYCRSGTSGWAASAGLPNSSPIAAPARA